MVIAVIIIIVLTLICIGLTIFGLWALGKLNKYIGTLESQIELQLDRIDELEDLIRESNIKSKKIIKRNIISEDDE